VRLFGVRRLGAAFISGGLTPLFLCGGWAPNETSGCDKSQATKALTKSAHSKATLPQ